KRTFSDNHNAEMFAETLTQHDTLRDLSRVVRNFGYKNDVRAAGNARLDGNPARMAPHNLDDDNAPMALCRRVQFVERIAGGVDVGVECDCVNCAADIVVDGFRDTDERNAFLVQLLCDAERPVTPDHDQRVEAQLSEIRYHRTGNIALDNTTALGQQR